MTAFKGLLTGSSGCEVGMFDLIEGSYISHRTDVFWDMHTTKKKSSF